MTKHVRRLKNRRDSYGLPLMERASLFAAALRDARGEWLTAEQIVEAKFYDVFEGEEDPEGAAAAYVRPLSQMVQRQAALYPTTWPWRHIEMRRRGLPGRGWQMIYRWRVRPADEPEVPVQNGSKPEATNPAFYLPAVDVDEVLAPEPEEVKEDEADSYVLGIGSVLAEPEPEPKWALLRRGPEWEQVGTTSTGEPILRRDGVLYRVVPL